MNRIRVMVLTLVALAALIASTAQAAGPYSRPGWGRPPAPDAPVCIPVEVRIRIWDSPGHQVPFTWCLHAPSLARAEECLATLRDYRTFWDTECYLLGNPSREKH